MFIPNFNLKYKKGQFENKKHVNIGLIIRIKTMTNV